MRLSALDVKVYAICDTLTGPLIILMVVFSPWAFGTTQGWSIGTMNVAGWMAGTLWVMKSVIRHVKGHQAPRWEGPRRGGGVEARHLRMGLGGLTVGILAYTLTSAWNARSTFQPETLTFIDHAYVGWLPHSFDSVRTWSAFWSYLGLAGGFWAVQDWIICKTAREQQLEARGLPVPGPFPARVRLLLWVLAVNGGLLALEGIVQRLEGSGRLLFLVQPRVNPGAEAQFGPYAYRANASQYLNLVWPVALGFWWTLQRRSGKGKGRQHWLLASAIVMAASPIISTSRGGAMIAILIGVVAAVYLLMAEGLSAAAGRGVGKGTAAAIGVFLVAFLGIGFALGWKALKPRMDELQAGYELREEMFDTARPMARDYPVFGTGPGTFEYAFTLYRIRTDTYWPAQLHNDWLETRITFGVVGMCLVLGALLLVVVRPLLPGGIYGGRRFIALVWLALAGALLHARYDFPFQIHSILFLTLVLCALLLRLSRVRLGDGEAVRR